MLEPFSKDELHSTALYLDLVPYDIGRHTLYDADTLYGPDRYDERVYEAYLQAGKLPTSPRELLARSIHDYCIRKAIEDFMDGRNPLHTVAVMGGHNMQRTDKEFRQIASISKRLTERGRLMISGGGPGAMEATHLGAWLASRTTADVDAALAMLAAAPTFKHPEWLTTAMDVRRRFPQEQDYVSLGVPTWLYGHEPATPFASHIAKLFDNSLREDLILTSAFGGIIFTPGSAGTMQEIFQEAVQNHYLSFGFASPMIFLGHQFWTEDVPIFPLLSHLLQRGTYKNLLLTITDDEDEVIDVLCQFKPER